MGIATFADAETGEAVTIDTDGAIIGSVGKGDNGTVIITHIPSGSGSFVVSQTHVRDDFWDVIDELAKARSR